MELLYTTGFAGTGKSTRLLKLVNEELNSATSILLAPTHKALERLRPEVTSGIELKTIHSLLGWVPAINENAEQIHQIDTVIRLDRELDEYTDIVIDEAGMMSEDMLMEITSKLEEFNNFETDHIKIHLFLDPYQLLPVKGAQIEIDPTTTTNLTKQYRSESPDVVELYTKFVHYLTGENKRDLTLPESDNVVYVTNTDKFREGDRLLAYTNICVGDYNQRIAEQLGIESYVGQEVQLGSQPELYLVDEFVKPTLRDMVTWFDSGKLKLQNSKINKRFLVDNLSAMLSNEHITFISSGGSIIPVIEGIGYGNHVVKEAKSAALEDKKKFKEVYALGRAFIMDYSFASTVHKSQGSEFSRVWVDVKDIKRSIFKGNYKNYARMMYVSISRAKQRVYLLNT